MKGKGEEVWADDLRFQENTGRKPLTRQRYTLAAFQSKRKMFYKKQAKKPPEEKSHHLLGSNTGRACVTQRSSEYTSLELVEIARGEDTIFCKY